MKPTIIIHSNYCEIAEEKDIKFLQILDNELSFKLAGVEHMPAYKGYYKKGKFIKWDGITRLLTNRLTFPIGLLGRVKDLYSRYNKQISVLDNRPPKLPDNKIDILPKLLASGKTPFQHQLEILKAAEDNDYGIIRAATGAGKSIISALITARFGKSTILYVIGTDLLHQMHRLFSSLFDFPIGKIGDGVCEIHDINIASVWTVGQALGLKKSEIFVDDSDDEISLDQKKHREIREMMAAAKVHIFDECHLAACKTIQQICKNIHPERVYGMSASPWRDTGDEMLIEAALGKNIIDISASLLIERNILVKPIIKFLKVPPPTERLEKNYQNIYSNYIINNPVRNGMIANSTKKLVEKGYKTLVLFNNISHGDLIYKEISKDVKCLKLSGKDSSAVREDVKSQLEDGKIDCILASKIFDIGVDIPALSGLVLAGGGKSSVRALQRCGRVIRGYPGKKQAAIVEFYDQAPYVKEHSEVRRKIYSTEPKFEIHYPE